MKRNDNMKWRTVTIEESRQTKLEEFGFTFTAGEINE
tara:strand:- start:3684 stop:3794 length:111 start_codon:yes stop_codon:yes gene_type:complete